MAKNMFISGFVFGFQANIHANLHKTKYNDMNNIKFRL